MMKKNCFYPITVSHMRNHRPHYYRSSYIIMRTPTAAADVNVTMLPRCLLKARWFTQENNNIILSDYCLCSVRRPSRVDLYADRVLTWIRRKSFITLSLIGHHLSLSIYISIYLSLSISLSLSLSLSLWLSLTVSLNFSLSLSAFACVPPHQLQCVCWSTQEFVCGVGWASFKAYFVYARAVLEFWCIYCITRWASLDI